ncbi:MAG: HD-GYP domain-containing protein [Treponema sp.]|jgi:HD-GYP domain-containing protein (c-di-GMP phosphodiesterase class II)|nr:HD-GYP domain-containing protein [Treponema sp.]
MKSFPLRSITQDGYFTQAVYLDSQFILTAPEMPVSSNLTKVIEEWGFTELFSDGEPRAADAAETVKVTQETVKSDLSTTGDLDKIQKAEVFYISFQKYVKTLFAFLPVRNELDFNAVAEKIKEVCDYVRENRRFLMRTQWLTSPVQEENQMVSHATRSTIIAITIGLSLKLQNYRLIELGVSALLHEVGMIKLPQENYTKKQAITEQERKLLQAHPILGYNLLKSYDFPLVICMGALEHHERENGNGYPQRKTGGKISLYSKIIAVACSYEAISSSRSYKEAKDGHTGIMELLKNEGKQYDDTIVRALVFSLSIYPIGLYVLLSNGKKGQVVDADPENPRCPTVEIFGELMPNGKNRTRQLSEEFTIVRPLRPEEFAGLTTTQPG